jgi:hypothetical protein
MCHSIVRECWIAAKPPACSGLTRKLATERFDCFQRFGMGPRFITRDTESEGS